MTESSDIIRKTREDLFNKFIKPARDYGQTSLAEALEEILPQLTLETVKREIGNGVTTMSLKAKANAEVTSKQSLDIVTQFQIGMHQRKACFETKRPMAQFR